MSIRSEAIAWLERESPDVEEIKQTIDNLAFQHSVSGPEQRTELEAVILQLCKIIGLDPGTVVLAPETNATSEPSMDLGPLDRDDQVVEELPAMERARRFRELKDLLERPF